jgi:hypothetical protein
MSAVADITLQNGVPYLRWIRENGRGACPCRPISAPIPLAARMLAFDAGEFEPCSAPITLGHGDPPAVSLGDLFDDPQPESGSVRIGRVARLKNRLTLSLGNPGTGIRHVEPSVHRTNRYRQVVTAVFNRIPIALRPRRR